MATLTSSRSCDCDGDHDSDCGFDCNDEAVNDLSATTTATPGVSTERPSVDATSAEDITGHSVGDSGAVDAVGDDRIEEHDDDEEGFAHDVITGTNTATASTSTSILGPIANLCSATLGAGVLSIPYCLYQSGLIVGVILLILSACSTILSIDWIVEAARKHSAATYEELIGKALGNRARRMAEVSILLFCEGVCVAYLIAVGDILSMLVGDQYRKLAIILVWSLTMLPLSLLRTMESLQWASSIGIISIGLLVVAALQHAIQNHGQREMQLSSILWPADGLTSVLRALPMIIFAFSCQVNVCAIYTELPTKSSMKWVTRGAVAICSFLYLSIASICLLDFGAAVEGNILLNYDIRTSSVLIHVAFASMAAAVVMAFPLNVFPSRSAIEGRWDMTLALPNIGDDDLQQSLLLNDDDGLEETSGEDQQSLEPREVTFDNSFFGLMRHVMITVLIAGTALGLALVVPNISLVFGIVGGTISSILGFILPGALSIVSGNIHFGYFMVICGSLVGVITTAITVITI